MNLFFLDFETTGLNPYLHDIIEVAIKKYNEGEYYQTLIKPKKLPPGLVSYVPPHITNITNITDQMIVDHSITKSKALYNVLQYIQKHNNDGPIYIISHNGTVFDFIIFKKLLDQYIQKKNFTRFKETLLKRFRYIDTLLLAKFFLDSRVNQPFLCKEYNITNNEAIFF